MRGCYRGQICEGLLRRTDGWVCERGYTSAHEEGGHLKGYVRGGASYGVHGEQTGEIEDHDAIASNELFQSTLAVQGDVGGDCLDCVYPTPYMHPQ